MANVYLDPRSASSKSLVWRFQISDAAGHRQYPTFEKAKYTKTAAKAAAEDQQDTLRERGSAIRGNPKELFGDFGLTILTGRINQYTNLPVSLETEQHDLEMWRTYIMPHDLAKVEMRKISHLSFLDFKRDLGKLKIARGPRKGQPLGRNTQAAALARVRVVMNYAVEYGLCSKNDLDRAKFFGTKANGSHGKKLISVAEADFARAYLATRGKINGPDLGLLRFELMLLMGPRPGELAGLQWDKIAMQPEGTNAGLAAIVTIDKAVGGTKKATAVLKAPKTASGIRTLYLPERLRPLLSSVYQQQATARAAAGIPETDPWFVITNGTGTMMNKKSLTVWWGEERVGCGLPTMTPYGFRYSAGGNHLAAGRDIVATSKMLGHSGPEITLRVYAPSSEEQTMVAALAFLDRMAPKPVEPPKPTAVVVPMRLAA